MVRDGEGATRFIEITVRGARDDAEARQVGMSVARSQLVKTAIYGQDANWGRIICAVGYSGAAFDPDRVGVWLGDLELVRAGAPFHIDEARAAEILAPPDVPVAIDLGQGEAELTVWTCDLSHGYVDINAQSALFPPPFGSRTPRERHKTPPEIDLWGCFVRYYS
jgi:glutamate N-acetyltransferase/amino-acid N-acetyltransferase